MTERQHEDHWPIDDDYDDDDHIKLSEADVKGVSYTPGTPEHAKYTKELEAMERNNSGTTSNSDTQFKRPSGEAGGGKLDLAKYRRKK